MSTSLACSSWLCPAPGEETQDPFKRTAAPTVKLQMGKGDQQQEQSRNTYRGNHPHPSDRSVGTRACRGASEEPSPSDTKLWDFMCRTDRMNPLTTTSPTSVPGFHSSSAATGVGASCEKARPRLLGWRTNLRIGLGTLGRDTGRMAYRGGLPQPTNRWRHLSVGSLVVGDRRYLHTHLPNVTVTHWTRPTRSKCRQRE